MPDIKTDPYQEFGGKVLSQSGSIASGAPQSGTLQPPAAQPNPYAEFQGAGPSQNQEPSLSANEDPGVLKGIYDNLADTVKGFGQMAKVQYQHEKGMGGKVIQDLHEGSYSAGLYDAAKALLWDSKSPFHRALRQSLVYEPAKEFARGAGETVNAAQDLYHGLGGNKEALSEALPDTGRAILHYIGAIPAVGGAIVKTGQDINDKPKYGLGELIGNVAQVAVPEAMAKYGVVGKVANKLGESLESGASRAPNSILRANKEKNFLYGKDPGRALIDENIRPTNSLENLKTQLKTAGNNLHGNVQQILNSPAVRAQKLDVGPMIRSEIDNALNTLSQKPGMTNRAEVVGALQKLKTDLLEMHDPQTGKAVPGSALRSDLSPAEVNEIKKSIGENTRWDTVPGSVDPAITEAVNKMRKNLYGKLNDMVDSSVKQVGPDNGIKALNKRYSNVIEASRLLDARIAKEGMNELGLARLLKHSELGAAGTAVAAGHPVVAGGLLANYAWRTTLARILRGQIADVVGGSLTKVHPGGLPGAAHAAAAASINAPQMAQGALSETDATNAPNQ